MAKYTNGQVTFNNVIKPSFLTTGRLAKGNYETDSEGNIVNKPGPFVNAIDIDWNAATIGDLIINNTSDFIQRVDNTYTKEESDEKYQAAGNYLITDDITGYATEDYVNSKVQEEITRIVDNAPEALDTLKEIANQLENNENVVSSLTNTIAGKANIDHNHDELYASKDHNHDGVYLTEHQDLSEINNSIGSIRASLSEKMDNVSLATVATSGDYNDLVNKPEIPNNVDLTGYATEQYVSDNYQPKGEYLTIHQDISGKANVGDSYTKQESDDKFAEKTTVATLATTVNSLNELYQPIGDYATDEDISSLTSDITSLSRSFSDFETQVEEQYQEKGDYTTKEYVDNAIESIIGAAPENFDTLKEIADAMGDLKVVDVEAVPAVEGEHYTQEEIDAAKEGDEAYGKTVDDWKVEPVEAVEEQSHNMTIAEFVAGAMQSVDEKEAVAKVQAKYEALLTLLNIRDSQVNSIIINQELQESSTVTFDEVVSDIVIPETTDAYTVTAPLEDDSTVTLTSNKYMTLFNTSEEPVSTTIQYDAHGATGSGTTVYLVGEYDTLTVENVSPNVKSGQDAAKVNNIVITEDNTKNITLALDFQDGATITNNSATNVTITDKNNEATVLTVVAPNSTVTLNGGTFEVLNATVSDNTLIIKKTAHIGDLIVNHGNVKVEVPRESDIANIITGKIVLGDPKSSLIVDHTNFATARHAELTDYYNNYPTEANQDGETWPAFTPSKFPWLVINHEFDGDTEVTVYYQGEKVFGDWKPSAKVEQEGGTLVDRTYAILSVPEDLGLTQFTESAAGNEILLNPEDIEVRLVSNKVDYLHDEITSANISKLTSTGTHVLTEDITKNGRFAPGIFASDDIVWDLNGHNITFTNTQGYANFLLRGTLHLEINGNGTITNNAGDYGFWSAAEGVNVVINGGTYYAATHVLYAEKGTIEVNDGEFHLTNESSADKDSNGNFKFLLNCLDASYTSGKANIIVKGGTFYGFNPAVTYGEPGSPVSYVPEGYESVQKGTYDYIDNDNNTITMKIYTVRKITENSGL